MHNFALENKRIYKNIDMSPEVKNVVRSMISPDPFREYTTGDVVYIDQLSKEKAELIKNILSHYFHDSTKDCLTKLGVKPKSEEEILNDVLKYFGVS